MHFGSGVAGLFLPVVGTGRHPGAPWRREYFRQDQGTQSPRRRRRDPLRQRERLGPGDNPGGGVRPGPDGAFAEAREGRGIVRSADGERARHPGDPRRGASSLGRNHFARGAAATNLSITPMRMRSWPSPTRPAAKRASAKFTATMLSLSPTSCRGSTWRRPVRENSRRKRSPRPSEWSCCITAFSPLVRRRRNRTAA